MEFNENKPVEANSNELTHTTEVERMEEIDADEENAECCPFERSVIPADVTDISDEDTYIQVIGTQQGKVTEIKGLEGCKNLDTLILRSCLVRNMSGIETLSKLEKLELYDNQLTHISFVENLPVLKILDISFNSIRDMSPVSCLTTLEELYIAQNKLREIKGISNLVNLKILDLGANRIRVIALLYLKKIKLIL